ncbi:hypothetical protein [Streptococcus sp. E17BB]|uniref:hypothetical protein n=1 Tax=Streptococcus sp. E17BB TaxID=3278714 RepID=UPI00359EE4F1
MAKLEVKDNKKLVLKQVICKKVHGAKVENVDHEIDKFHQHLQLVKAQTIWSAHCKKLWNRHS